MMKPKLQITQPLVSVAWLAENIDAPNIIIIDATIKNVTASNNDNETQDLGIKKARFLDIKNVFSDTSTSLPNTMLSADTFQKQARALGVNNDSAIVVYDGLGVYSSPRVWWMFKAMGHNNIAVLNGGLPEWIRSGHATEPLRATPYKKGDFTATYNPASFADHNEVLKAITDDHILIADARSADRFMGLVEEPREGLRAGHIPSSTNVPYTVLQHDGKMLEKERLRAFFNKDAVDKDKVIFTCGSGITACILALGADISGLKNLAVYDGSWTEWGSNHTLPIEK